MSSLNPRIGLAAIAVLAAGVTPAAAGPFETKSKDGTVIHGAVEEAVGSNTAVILVAGTGLFDRDVRFGLTGTERDLIFKDLAARIADRGVAVVRYDRRGVRWGAPPSQMLDVAVAATSTVETQRDDLAAVYDWTRSPAGLNARCVVLFGHSEGVAHIARLAGAGAPAPVLVLGMGAAMSSPRALVHWQSAERDAYSLRLMDADGDGRVTTAEVEANWRKTPSSFAGRVDLLQHPSGAWTQADLAQVEAVQAALYEQQKAAALATPDDAPFPNAATPMARYSWWKSWFTDDVPLARRLSAWPTPVVLHYGEIDSQTPPSREVPVAKSELGARLTTVIHPGKGHALGDQALMGPIDEALADQLADTAATAAKACGARPA